MKIKELIKEVKEELQDFKRYYIRRPYDAFAYRCWRVPFWKMQLVFKYLDWDIVPWEICESSIEMLFAQYIMFFETQEEHLTPWLQDGVWQEHKHSEGWEYTPKGTGTGLKYKDMLEIYMYVKYTRHENEKKKDELLDLLYGEENHKSWWEDSETVLDGEKCRTFKCQKLKNFKISYKFSKSKVDDKAVYTWMSDTDIMYRDKMFSDLYADNILIDVKELPTVSDRYRRDTDIYHKVETAITDKDNEYAKKIIDIRGYLWW